MPYDPRTAFWFLVGFAFALWCLGPLAAVRAAASDAGLVQLESALHEDVNRFRQSQNLIPLQRRGDLDRVARAHSEDMVRRGYFAHESPEGSNWVDRLRAGGIQGFALAGENVGQTNRSMPNAEILEGWKASPVHRENLTARPYNATGIGIARAPDGTLFYTQVYLTFPR